MSVVMASKAMAALAREPVLELNTAESDIWSDTFVTFLDQFEVAPDPRVMAALNLGAATLTLMGPRVAVIMANDRAKRAAKAGSGSTARPPTDPNADHVNVVQLRPDASPMPEAPAEPSNMSAEDIAAMIALNALQPGSGTDV